MGEKKSGRDLDEDRIRTGTQHSSIPNADMHFCQTHSTKEAGTVIKKKKQTKRCSSASYRSAVV